MYDLSKFAEIKEFAELERALIDLRTDSANGDGVAAFAIAVVHNPGNTFIQRHLKRRLQATEENALGFYNDAYDKLLGNARVGNGEAMHLIATYYQTGTPPVEHSMKEFLLWCTKAFAAGYLFAANDLYSIHADPKGSFYDREKADYYARILEQHKLRFVP